jgi:hypothetical protein
MKVDLNKHLAFLDQLDEGLDDALGRYSGQSKESLAELHNLKREIQLARKAVRMLRLNGYGSEKETSNKLSRLVKRGNTQLDDRAVNEGNLSHA